MAAGTAAAVAAHGDHYQSTNTPTWKIGFWTFIGSECLFFGTLISTYMVYKGASVQGPLIIRRACVGVVVALRIGVLFEPSGESKASMSGSRVLRMTF